MATPDEATPIGRPMARTDPKADEQDHDGEGQADQLGLGRFELGQGLSADLDLECFELRPGVAEIGPELGGVGVVEVAVDVQRGERDLSTVIARGRDLGQRAGDLVRARDLDTRRGVREGEHLLHRSLDLGILDAAGRLEHDRPLTAVEAVAGEVVLEELEAVLGLGVGDRDRRAEP